MIMVVVAVVTNGLFIESVPNLEMRDFSLAALC